ncbi:MAG TPA: peptidase E [Actinomycetes bacterium]
MTPPVPRILATSGGFRPTPRWGVLEPAGLVAAALRLSGKDRPRLAFVLTASGDDPQYLARMYGAFRGWSVDLTHLSLFTQPTSDPRELLLQQDVVWVGGGSVANLLAVWRVHGLDTIFREAWEAGIVLGGVSAGSICWHVGGPTDSYGPELQLQTGGLGLLPYGNGVHYDSEEQRRPLLHRLVAAQELPLSYATDDGIGVLYEGIDPVEVIADDPQAAAEPQGPAAYRVERAADGSVVETRLTAGALS